MIFYISKLARISLSALVILPLGLAFKVETASAKLNFDLNTEHNLPAKNIIAQVELDNSIAVSNVRYRSRLAERGVSE